MSIGLMGAWFRGWIRGWQDLLKKVVCSSPTVWMDQSFFRHCKCFEWPKRPTTSPRQYNCRNVYLAYNTFTIFTFCVLHFRRVLLKASLPPSHALSLISNVSPPLIDVDHVDEIVRARYLKHSTPRAEAGFRRR